MPKRRPNLSLTAEPDRAAEIALIGGRKTEGVQSWKRHMVLFLYARRDGKLLLKRNSVTVTFRQGTWEL